MRPRRLSPTRSPSVLNVPDRSLSANRSVGNRASSTVQVSERDGARNGSCISLARESDDYRHRVVMELLQLLVDSFLPALAERASNPCERAATRKVYGQGKP